jgi:hypothetical protein
VLFAALGVIWASLTVMATVRRVWPARRRIPRPLLVNLALGSAAVLLRVFLGREDLAADLAWGSLIAAAACQVIPGLRSCVRSRLRTGRPWFSATRRIGGSHVYIWTDAAVLGLSIAFINHAFRIPLPAALFSGAFAGLFPAVVGSARLWRHHHGALVSEASPPRLPAYRGGPPPSAAVPLSGPD